MTAFIEAVIFDQGGVLTRGGRKGANEEAVTRAMGLRETIEIPDLIEDLKRDKDNSRFVEEVNERYPDAPKKLTGAVWRTIYSSLTREPTVYEFADQCRSAGLRVGLLSNINRGVAKLLDEGGAYEGFDPLVLSCEVGYAKPDPEIYVAVEEGLRGISPCNILLLDDQEKCVKGAQKRGWKAIKVVDPRQMVEEASKLLGFV